MKRHTPDADGETLLRNETAVIGVTEIPQK